MPSLAYAIGTRGRVYAVEIDKGFLDEIDRKVEELHISQIETVLGTPADPKLPTRNLAKSSMLSTLGAVVMTAIGALTLRARRLVSVAKEKGE